VKRAAVYKHRQLELGENEVGFALQGPANIY
jgi:hypothetical protein